MEAQATANIPADLSAEEQAVWELLEEVKDPEIPTVSVVELGMIEGVEVQNGSVTVEFIPTFSGCPAIDVIERNIAGRLEEEGYSAEVKQLNKAWTTDRIAESAKHKMKQIGLAPARKHGGDIDAEQEKEVECPYCGSSETVKENPFGPTLCRAIYYCEGCEQPFEKFKEL